MKFGRLKAIKRIEKNGHTYWRCRCDCSKLCTIRQDSLRSGATKSCGCFHDSKIVHGHSARRGKRPSPEYYSWTSMLSRTRNPHATGYKKSYGGKGVKVCDRWNPQRGGSFLNFLSDLGRRLPGTELSRFRDRGSYRPGNVSYQTRSQQWQQRRFHQAPVGKIHPVSKFRGS
jgi:hypothetical protein